MITAIYSATPRGLCARRCLSFKGTEARLSQARLPWIKTLEQFDLNFQPSVDREVVRELSTLSFVGRAENIVLLGPPGVRNTPSVWPSRLPRWAATGCCF